MAPPIVIATTQSAVLAATSNFLAQTLTAYHQQTPLVIDWVPMFQFVLYSILSTPPNFLWQEFLESTFPAYHMTPTTSAIRTASSDSDAALEKEAREGTLVEPKLNLRNTFLKWLLDQTLGCAVNTILFSLFIHGIQDAMVRPLGSPLSTPDQSSRYLLQFLLGNIRGAADSGAAGSVDWNAVVQQSRTEFSDLVFASWKLWPFVSVVNFAFIKSVQGRNLLGALAGVGWGVYVSLFAAR